MRPLIRFYSFSRQGNSQEWHCPSPASQTSHSPLPTAPQIFRPTRAVRSIFIAPPRYHVHEFHISSVRNLPILCQICQWRSECHLFLYPVADSVRRVTRSLLHNITTRINDGASICAVMRLGLAWITKWPRGLAFNQRTSFCHVAVSILTFMFC